MTLVASIVAEWPFALFFMTRHALTVECTHRGGYELVHRFGVAVCAGLRFRLFCHGFVAGVAIGASLDALVIHVFMAITALCMVCFFQANHVLCVFFLVAIGTRLRFRFYVCIVVTGLAIILGIVGFVPLVREFFDGRIWVMTGYALFFVDGVLMIGNEYFVEFFHVAVGTGRRCLFIPGRVMAGGAILIFTFGVRCMGENDFAALVVKEDTHWRTIRPGWCQVADQGCDE